MAATAWVPATENTAKSSTAASRCRLQSVHKSASGAVLCWTRPLCVTSQRLWLCEQHTLSKGAGEQEAEEAKHASRPPAGALGHN